MGSSYTFSSYSSLMFQIYVHVTLQGLIFINNNSFLQKTQPHAENQISVLKEYGQILFLHKVSWIDWITL